MTAHIRLLGFLVLAAPLLSFADARAFDGHRQGFVLGFGAGPGYLDFAQFNENTIGVQTDFKLGVGLNDRTILHYTGKQIWHYDNSIAYTEALPMLGLTRYMKPESPSFFVSGGGGVGFLALFADDIGGGNFGPATYLGGGYEFARHWGVELGVAATWAEEATLYNAYLTFNLLGY